MKDSIELKQQVLQALKAFMMGEEGKKFKPTSVEVEMSSEPKAGLKDVLKKASEDNPVDEEELDDMPVDEEEDEDKPMTLKEFLANKR